MLVKIIGTNMYITKRYKRVFSVLNLKVLSTCLARGRMFENVGFLRDQKCPPILDKYTEIGEFLYLPIPAYFSKNGK